MANLGDSFLADLEDNDNEKLDEDSDNAEHMQEDVNGDLAPNLSAIVGSAVAAKLIGTAGGLSSLAKMPACKVQCLGAMKKALAGFSTAKIPRSLKKRACRVLAGKSTLAARVDYFRGDPSGSQGRTYRDDIRKKIEKWQEPPPKHADWDYSCIQRIQIVDKEKLDEDTNDAVHMEEHVNGDLADIEALNYDDLDSVSMLQKSQRYADIMKKVEYALEKGSDMSNQGMVLEDDPEYQLIVECNKLSVDIENEIVIIHNFIRDKYRFKFPELESLVHHPIDYARVVKKIGNEVDLTIVDLEGLLRSAIIMIISVTASTTSGKPLPEDVLQKTIEACDRALTLDASKKKVLDFIESRMGYIAPNLSAIVGSAVAAKLIGKAGGLKSLAKMPAGKVQLLGPMKKALAGFSAAKIPRALKMRVWRILAEKSTLAARVDYFRGDPSGSQGRTYLDDIRKNIEKWQEPPPKHADWDYSCVKRIQIVD